MRLHFITQGNQQKQKKEEKTTIAFAQKDCIEPFV